MYIIHILYPSILTCHSFHNISPNLNQRYIDKTYLIPDGDHAFQWKESIREPLLYATNYA